MAGDHRHTVQSVDRAMLLLETLAGEGGAWRLKDLAKRTGLSPSTAHRLLTTLEQRRFVQFDAGQALWSVGRQAFSVGVAFSRRQGLLAPALPILRDLRDQTHETVNLGMFENLAITVIGQVESHEIIRAITRVGGVVPMIGSAMGKAVLANLPNDAIEALVTQSDLRPIKPHNQNALGQLRCRLAQVRADGFAVDDEEHHPGLRCVAGPVFNHIGDVVGAISVSGLAIRLTPARIATVGALAAEAGKQLSARFSLPEDGSAVPPPAAWSDPSSAGQTIRHLAE
jgi:IclR family transcriptional regulator, acetate operon repressor